ncbi:hypothetical protein NSPZN2_30634 [Nitrospira defluvii]|uniref:Uncharacterized protein n=1 Tax=Nitrospira defluvii TaxID=330214 RepID=A0ABN7LUA5_9BACT|nr:hypothetical protein NSPZN2_30634 [Nitrospira defluvii]
MGEAARKDSANEVNVDRTPVEPVYVAGGAFWASCLECWWGSHAHQSLPVENTLEYLRVAVDHGKSSIELGRMAGMSQVKARMTAVSL